MSDRENGEERDEPTERPDEPTTEELREPSTEKDPGEEPKAPHSGDDGEPEPSHRAEGIGVIAPDGPDADEAPV
ncbi:MULTISPECIES: hypothetical protein [unclassified Microbacterium]|uniref:hypothetical protein n=1 Tax=unclassified Microbacterium TaxID=2609290 RepID=UPI0020421FF5|nr:hypothetical protein [Microbacterium sp. USTB-Y]